MSTMTRCSGFRSSRLSFFTQGSTWSAILRFRVFASDGVLYPLALLPDALFVKLDIARPRSMLGSVAFDSGVEG